MPQKVQGRHVVSIVTDPEADEIPTFVTPFGSDTPRLAWQPHADNDLDSDFNSDSDFQDSDDEPPRKKSRKAATAPKDSKAQLKADLAAGRRFLPRARILDIHGYRGNRYEEFETALEGVLEKVQTLRVFDTSYLFLYVRPPHTIVFFERPGSYLNPNTRKLVYHYSGTEEQVKSAGLPDWEATYSSSEMDLIEWVYLLLKGQPAVNVRESKPIPPPANLIRAALDFYSRWIPNPADRRQQTIVGGHKLILSALGLPPDATPEDLKAATSEHVNVRFLTPEEYETEVGPEQFALETRADPYDGPCAVFHS